MQNKRAQWNAMVGAVGVVFGMGGYIGDLYSNSTATFGMIAILILGYAIVRLLTNDQGPT